MSDADAPQADSVEVEVFPHSPVSEAILGIELPQLDDLTGYADTFHAALRDRFPIREPIETPGPDDFAWPAAKPRAPHGARRVGPLGFRLFSEDRLEVAQVTRRSLSYHRLSPYVNWDHFMSGAVPAWRAFARAFSPEFVASLRLRYLNRIEIPERDKDLSEYLRMLLTIPKPVDTGFSGYLMRVTLHEPHSGAEAHVTQLSELGGSVEAPLTVIFDIDVRLQGEIAAHEDALWPAVQHLRNYKNLIFFSSLTDKARRLFR